MPRTARIKSSTGLYHVIMRGINHQNIFDSDSDKRMFLKIISDLRKRPLAGNRDSDWKILAYALMNNHFHLLIQEGDVSLGDIVKKIACAYVQYYNRKNRRDGHLFKERFKSEPCEDDDYLITLLRYIHQNPQKAGIVRKVADYEFTSWHEYLNDGKVVNKICDTESVLSRFGEAELIELVNQPLGNDTNCLEYEEQTKHYIDDDEAIALVEQRFGLTPYQISSMPSKKRKPFIRQMREEGCGARQIARILNLNISTVVLACKL